MLPKEFEVRMKEQLGQKYSDFNQALQNAPPVSIRLNPKKFVNQEYRDSIPWAAEGRYLSSRPVFTLDPHLHAGAYYVQEASSMFLEQTVIQSIDVSKPLRVLDLCAAPGGKSTHLLSLLNLRSLLISNEVIRSRASILSENIQKWGHHNVVVTNSDPEDFQALEGFFDLIVVDAPCSGEGLFRKDADAMKEWSSANIELCSHRQQRILNAIWPSLKQGGVMIYSTCTYNENENEENLIWLKNKREAEFISIRCEDAWGIQEVNKSALIGYRFYPHRVKGEGLFISAVRKLEATQPIKIKPRFGLQPVPSKTKDRLRDWLHHFEEKELILLDDLICMIPKDRVADLEFIISCLKTVLKGTAVATQKHEKLVPEHAFALSTEINKGIFTQLNLTKDQAVSFLRKENLMLAEGQKGFALVNYEGSTLGWVNLLGNRVNNLYPSSWRIRMEAKSTFQ
jgi:16S rRNA C967 or C1407 C5-methylase (RsmB/RsmF family)/NOL1/NOP2/fmu family ribosome biogenesis protein